MLILGLATPIHSSLTLQKLLFSNVILAVFWFISMTYVVAFKVPIGA